MTSPVKPPSKPPSLPPVSEAGRRGVAASSDAFQKTLEATRADSPERAAETHSTDAISRIADDLRAGRIDSTVAAERVIERALGSEMASVLPPAQRAELEAMLRQAMAEDPTLMALTKELERGV